MDIEELIRELDSNLSVKEYNKHDNTTYITCEKDTYNSICPYRGEMSNSIHSKYTRTVSDRIKLIKDDEIENDTIAVLAKRQQDKIDTANRKWELIIVAKKLYEEGNIKTYIAKKLDISGITLNKYLLLKESLVKDSNCVIDDYIPLIKEVIIEKKKTKEIYGAMKDKGYKGKMAVLNMYMKGIKAQIKNNTTYLKRSKLKKHFFYDLENIKNGNLRNDITFYLDQNEALSKIIELNSFVELIRSDLEALKVL